MFWFLIKCLDPYSHEPYHNPLIPSITYDAAHPNKNLILDFSRAFLKLIAKSKSKIVLAKMSFKTSPVALLFDHQVKNNFGYVFDVEEVPEIVREWELYTNSSFTVWSADKDFGNIGKCMIRGLIPNYSSVN